MESVDSHVTKGGKYKANPPGVKPKPGRPPNLENMPLKTVADARRFLARMVQLVIKGEIETKDAYCANAIVNTMLRATETDLEERLTRVEKQIDQKGH